MYPKLLIKTGSNSTILQGVTIGSGSIITAGSIVNKDVPANVLFGGTGEVY